MNRRFLLLDDCEDVASRQEQILLAVVLDLGSAVLAVNNDVADLDVERNALLAILIETAGAGRDDGALLGLLLGGVRDDQAGSGGLLGFEGLDQDAVLEGLDVDRHDVVLSDLSMPMVGEAVSSPRWGVLEPNLRSD